MVRDLALETSARSANRKLIRGLLILGTLLRVYRYMLNSPLWWNEAFLSVNFLRRGFFELLQPLDYNQVCPPGFLWVELALVRILGFSEWSLRLFPLVCGIAALWVLATIATRLLPAGPAACSVGLLAIAYHPIRLCSEVKPYATDLLAAALVIRLTMNVLERPSCRALVWLLIATLFAVFFSYPAILVIGSSALLLCALQVFKGATCMRWITGLWVVSIGCWFALLQAVCARGQMRAAARSQMSEYWSEGFPGLGSILDAAGWLLRVSFSEAFSFPVGTGGVVSLITLVLLFLGSLALRRMRGRVAVLALVVPFVMSMGAAILGCYPFGVHARLAQHLVPSMALLAGTGLYRVSHAIWERVGFFRRRMPKLLVASAALVALGIVPLMRDTLRPYRSHCEHEAREFARSFWPGVERNAQVFCLRWDEAVAPWESTNPDVALYLCNQAIYSPARRGGPRDGTALNTRSKLFVLYWSPQVEHLVLDDWIIRRGTLVSHDIRRLAGHGGRGGQFEVYRFGGLQVGRVRALNALQ